MTTYNNDTCTVCLDDFDVSSQKTSLKCGHTFHVDCIINCLRKSNECPNCRDTAGNPKLSVSNNNIFNFFMDQSDDETSESSSVQEYDDFLNTMNELVKNNKNIKNSLKEFKTESKNFEKTSKKIGINYDKGLQEAANNYLKSYRNCQEYIDYCSERYKITNKFYNLRKSLEKNLSKNLDIELDQTTKNYIKEYLDDYIGNLYYFRAPRTIYI